MDVRLSPEQQAVRDAAAQVVDRLGPKTVADLGESGRAGKLRAAVERSGWLELRDGAERDAPLASGVETALVAEELGRSLADVAFVGPVLAAELCRRAGAPPADGRTTVVLDPTLASFAVAERAADAGVAIDAADAGTALVLLPDTGSQGWRLGRVPLRAAGTQLDLTRPTALRADGAAVAPVDSSRALDEEDLVAALALGLAVTSADLVGVMRGAVELARAYAVARRQYDAPIGSFQAVQHLLADAFVAMEGSRSVALHAAWAVDALAPREALAAAAVAKAYCARAARGVCETAVQVHGGIGNTWDCLAHVFLRRALLSSELFGGAEASVGRVLAHHGVGAPAVSGRGLR